MTKDETVLQIMLDYYGPNAASRLEDAGFPKHLQLARLRDAGAFRLEQEVQTALYEESKES